MTDTGMTDVRIDVATPLGEHRQVNRELSWLEFNCRVLGLAEEPGIPLLERAKFCAIVSTNLDEFFQIRVAALRDQIAAGIDEATWDGRTPLQQLTEISAVVGGLVARQETVYLDELRPALAKEGIDVVSWDDLGPSDRATLREYYDARIFPVLTPLAVDPAHPFPYISNLALSIAAHVADPDTGERRFVRLKIPDVFPRLLPIGDGRFVPSEEVIAAHLHTLFVGMIVEEWAMFRVTRNADLTLEEDEADDLLEAVELELRRRRFNKAIRLEVADNISDELLDLLVRELELDLRNVSRHRAMIDLSCLMQLHGLDRPDLKDRAWPPVTAGRLLVAEDAGRSIFSVIRDRALLVHHPYESFTSSVEQFIEQAAADRRVQSIKMTLYRAGGDSAILRSLIKAADSGKQVAVMVEIKARFDEATNVQWARQLERAGVHVVYGMVGLKTHCKVVLVVRDDGDQLRRYCHIGTGNYNSKTARIYEDLGFVTCDNDIGADVAQLFNHLTGYSRSEEYRTLLVAPRDLKSQLIDLIEHEVSYGSEGRITLKCNSLADPVIVESLYEREQGGGADRLCGARDLHDAGRRAWSVRQHPRPQHPRALPRAQPDLPLRARRLRRRRRARWADVPHRIGRPDAAQPRPAGRGAGADRPSQAPRVARPGAGVRPRRGRRPLGAASRRQLGAGRPRDRFEPDPQELMYRWTVERQQQSRR